MELKLKDLNISELIREVKDAIQDAFPQIIEKVKMNGITNDIIENLEFESKNQPIAIDIYIFMDRIYGFGEYIEFNHIECGYIDYDFSGQIVDGKGAQSLELELVNLIENEVNEYFQNYKY